ncbi:MFS transporter small subunit [Streptomyces winkii]|uniref:MFS transporter small subunit n=1 Tax=Streptomyces winkii TaxID=3051178 RepID=UPI0028D83F17|nr:hypothetical protein [Streptomyces sp. DSM 40971]
MTTGENSNPGTPSAPSGNPPTTGLFALAWIWVGVPMAYGLYELILKAIQLFTGG